MRESNVNKVVESGILLALGFVLSLLKIKLLPNGGSVTTLSMLPIVILGYKYGPKWGTLCGFIHGLLQVIEGGGIAPPVQGLSSYFLVFLLDYALAWSVIGYLAGLLRKISNKTQTTIAISSFVGIGGRFLCSFISGMLIWGVYAPEGQHIAIYSFLFNATYMVPEMLITSIIGYIIFSIPAMQQSIKPIDILEK